MHRNETRRHGWPIALLLGAISGGLVVAASSKAQLCSTNADCDDTLFCTGAELCLPTHPDADPQGCVAGAPPCPSAACTCNENGNVCETIDPVICTVDPPLKINADADGDGVDSIECGGTDCNDCDAARFPGNLEVCDLLGVDEDCNASTFGQRDSDQDGFVDFLCCNLGSCGTDCDDLRPFVNPLGTETCNGVDDDCDGVVDPVVSSRIGYEDLDLDGFGDPTQSVQVALEVCTESFGSLASVAGDCNILSPEVHPGATEICNGIDDDCDGVVDEGFSVPCGQ